MLNCNVQPKVYCPNMAKYTRRRIINDPLKWAVGHHSRRHSFDEVPPSPLYTCSFTLESGLKKVVFVYWADSSTRRNNVERIVGFEPSALYVVFFGTKIFDIVSTSFRRVEKLAHFLTDFVQFISEHFFCK